MNKKPTDRELIQLSNEIADHLIEHNVCYTRRFRVTPLELKTLIVDYLYQRFGIVDEEDHFSDKYETRFRIIRCAACGKPARFYAAELSDEKARWQNDPHVARRAEWLRDGDVWTCRECRRLPTADDDARKQERNKVTPEFRQKIYEMDGGQCVYCGQYPKKPVIEHVIPVSRGGETTIENCITACRKCNLKKGEYTSLETRMPLKYGRFSKNEKAGKRESEKAGNGSKGRN